MAEKQNYLLGYGERLVERIAPPATKPSKAHPYTFDQARSRLQPKMRAVADDVAALPAAACPHDEAVALLTLHPAYLAKSYFPNDLLRNTGMEAVGSRSREVTPEKWTKKADPRPTITAELYVAGPRKRFAELANTLAQVRETAPGATDLIKIEDFRTLTPEERLKPLRSDAKHPLLEVVLHAQPTPAFDFVIEGFEEYLDDFDVHPDLDRRIYAEGLCFMPVRVPRDVVKEVVKFAFLRVAREMPRLRQFRPMTRTVPGFTPFSCELPTRGPLDRETRVAVFDGGVAPNMALDLWVNRRRPQSVAKAVPEFQNHGTAVTSALLFGPLQDGQTAPQPYASVDHYRVLDDQTEKDDQSELYSVLHRITDVLQSRSYEFVNLSIGPDLPIEDNEVHAWTSVLDQLLASGRTLASIAVGNGGERDKTLGYHRIQTPADCVNGMSIGASDRTGKKWRRASYSCPGPGRSPGIVKPDALAFGGSSHEPFWVLGTKKPGHAVPVTGTSFASPSALRTALGVRAHFGHVLTPLALKALLLHNCEDGGHDRADMGWGRIPGDIEEIVLSDEHTAHVVYQGELAPAQWLRVPVPLPSEQLAGMVTLCATFCFATPTDPQDPIHYTRSGLEVRFRPHDGKRKSADQEHSNTSAFFQAGEFYLDEAELRADAHKWETTLHRSRRLRGSTLKNPVFDVHYNARSGGRNATAASKIPYALVVTVHSPKTTKLYDKVVQRYRTILEPLQPIIKIPIRGS